MEGRKEKGREENNVRRVGRERVWLGEREERKI